MSWKSGKGYEKDYCSSLSNLETFKKGECEKLGRKWSDDSDAFPKKPCPKCGQSVSFKAKNVPRTVVTEMGEVTYRRHHYWCNDCRCGFYPKDIELGFDDENLTGDVVLLALDLLMGDTFRATSKRMSLHHGLSMSATRIKHLFERKSSAFADAPTPRPPIPLPSKEKTCDLPVMIQVDGSMVRHLDGWHEVKLMSLEKLGDCGRLYLAETGEIERLEAQVRESQGFANLRKREAIWIADGARWIWRMKDRLCPHAHELLDFYHVMEHAHEAAKESYGENHEIGQRFADCFAEHLLSGELEDAFDLVKEHIPYRPRKKMDKWRAEKFESLLNYLESNHGRLNYAYFLKRGWPIGSGAIESAHKFVLQKRMKMSGMKWSTENVQRMATMRALHASYDGKYFSEALNMAA